MDALEYDPLRDDQLRLLEFSSTLESPASDERLTFSLRSYILDQAPDFIALSYTWGTEGATEVIRINGKIFYMRPNLKACLSRVNAARDGWRRLWIDAICINQTSVAERNAQVSRMDTTFSKATSVLAWLGDVADDDPEFQPGLLGRALTRIRCPGPMAGQLHIADPAWATPTATVLGADVDRAGASPRTRSAVPLGFAYLSSNCLHPSREHDHMFVPSWYSLPGRLYTRLYVADGPSSSYGESDGHARQLSRGVFLGGLIAQHHVFKATDKRDRIFALLGLVSQESKRVLLQVFPNYNMRYETVMLFAMAVIRQEVPVFPFRAIKAYYSPKMLHLDEEMGEKLWSIVAQHETPGSLYTAARSRNYRKLEKLQRTRKAERLSPGQSEELEKRKGEHESFVAERVRVLRALAQMQEEM